MSSSTIKELLRNYFAKIICTGLQALILGTIAPRGLRTLKTEMNSTRKKLIFQFSVKCSLQERRWRSLKGCRWFLLSSLWRAFIMSDFLNGNRIMRDWPINLWFSSTRFCGFFVFYFQLKPLFLLPREYITAYVILSNHAVILSLGTKLSVAVSPGYVKYVYLRQEKFFLVVMFWMS